MEKILDLYAQPYDPKNPLVCFDERPCQLIGNTIVPIPMKPGNCKKQDYQYKRNGTCCIFIAFCPGTGQRYTLVRKHRKRNDYAFFMQYLASQFPDADKIQLVQDNLNTHERGSFYTTFESNFAWTLSEKFCFYYTPKKASWLNMAEIEISALSKQCLDRRIPSINKLEKEVSIWTKARNQNCNTISWSFSKKDARFKLKKFYDFVKV